MTSQSLSALVSHQTTADWIGGSAEIAERLQACCL
jgi:hypothetical protein